MLDLPPELLELVFHFLGSIDDVHHLGRSWKKTYDIIRRQTIYVEIMRSIIRKSPQHRFDLQLCKMLDLHRRIVERMQQNHSQLPATRSSQFGYTLNEWESAMVSAASSAACENICCSDCLPNETVYEVLARYQGLRVLENLWLERQLTESDYVSADGCTDPQEFNYSFGMLLDRHQLHADGDIPSRSFRTPETVYYTALNSDQRARLHAAVTCVWLLNEIRWVLTNFAYPSRFDVQVLLLEKCRKYINKQRRIPVLDELDRYAVFKFIYHHLLPLYGSCLVDRDICKLPFTLAGDFTKDAVHGARYVLLSIPYLYLPTPP